MIVDVMTGMTIGIMTGMTMDVVTGMTMDVVTGTSEYLPLLERVSPCVRLSFVSRKIRQGSQDKVDHR